MRLAGEKLRLDRLKLLLRKIAHNPINELNIAFAEANARNAEILQV